MRRRYYHAAAALFQRYKTVFHDTYIYILANSTAGIITDDDIRCQLFSNFLSINMIGRSSNYSLAHLPTQKEDPAYSSQMVL